MADLGSLNGVGKTLLKELKSAGITTIQELLEYYPRTYEFRDRQIPFSSAFQFGVQQTKINTVCTVINHQFFGFGAKQTLKITVSDGTGNAALICFGRNFLANSLPVGTKIYLAGTFSIRFGELQSSSFDYEIYSEKPQSFGHIIPIYPLSGKLTNKFLRKVIAEAFEIQGKFLQDIIPEKLIEMNSLMSRKEAIKNIHFPKDKASLDKAARTLKYEELFIFQKKIRESVEKNRVIKKRGKPMPRTLQRKVVASLPFTLTPDQISTIDTIYTESLENTAISRIVQGDVGCGKTLIGFLSALPYIEAGMQTAFIAPTELLAEQHLKNAAKIFQNTGIRLAFLSGKLPQKKKELLLEALEAGEIDMLIGTHAIISQNVRFKNLAFAIIDEQQRFGVLQRNALLEKGNATDYIMMSATPIPRSLEMTLFGELKISTVRTMPPGRKPVITYTVMEGHENRIYDWVKKELSIGHQAYFVYPLIEDSDRLNLKNATEMAEYLQNRVFTEYKVALIHSRMKEDDKASIMNSFAKGEIQILVATSVVEVGVDVKTATCMVIQHADRFGLSSLHQLRGRVGRSELQSYTFLVFSQELSENGKERLKIMKETNDGFLIAEKDLSLRGPGDISGVEQSGFMNFHLADIFRDTELISQIRRDIEFIS
ncbi:MAG: ATP-dependent DNA helicase RecG [Spirochaetia bacterium]|nr:ATP-dependent DNA helicase RecG [Spirochaetia bacterium]